MSRIAVCTLVSGSSANCTYVEAGGAGILIDAGAGIRKTEQLLSSVGGSFSNLRGIFITHEHSDHIGGLKTILKKYRIPVLANRNTLCGITEYAPDLDDSLFCELPTGATAAAGDFSVTSFSCMHDSSECVGYVITTGNGKIGVCTDLGQVTDTVATALSGCRAVVLESNHDADMLMNGAYPYSLKQRIAGPCGHLSNQQCGDILPDLVRSGAQQVFLAHLSKENNTESLCLCTAENRLRLAGIRCGEDVRVQVAPRNDPSEVFELC